TTTARRCDASLMALPTAQVSHRARREPRRNSSTGGCRQAGILFWNVRVHGRPRTTPIQDLRLVARIPLGVPAVFLAALPRRRAAAVRAARRDRGNRGRGDDALPVICRKGSPR